MKKRKPSGARGQTRVNPSGRATAPTNELVPLLLSEFRARVGEYERLRAELQEARQRARLHASIIESYLQFFLKQGLAIPGYIDAVDPQARSTGKLSTRVKGFWL